MSRNGALNVAYAIRRNRYLGGRLNRAEGGEADMPDEGVPFNPPLFLRSGVEDVPPGPPVPPTRMHRGREVADYAQRDPDEAYEASRDRWGYMRDHPGETALGVGSVAAPVAGGIISSAMENAAPGRPQQRGLAPLGSPRRQEPEASGVPFAGVGSLMDLIGPSSAHAAEGDDVRPSEPVVNPNEQEASEIARLNGLIAAKREELKAANTMRVAVARDGTPITQSALKKESAVRAAQTAIDALQGDLARFSGPESPLGARRSSAMELYRDAVRRWEDRQEKLAAGKVNAELPYAQKYPGRQEWIQERMPVASGITGTAIGMLGRGKVIKPLIASTLAGAAEGAGTAAWPTFQDAEFLPSGSKGKKEAVDRIYDPQYWKENVVPGMGMHAAIAAGSSLAGSKIRQGLGQAAETAAKLRTLTKAPPAEPPVTAAPLPDVAPAARPKAPPKEYQLPDGTVLKKYDLGKRGVQWRSSADNNKVISAAKAEALRAQHAAGARSPSSALHEPSMKAAGGNVRSPMDIAYAVRRQNRAEGGEVHAGPILSSVPGRTDNHPMDVEEGAYILPADHISSLGEGNTMAGMEVVNHMIESLGVDPQHRGQGNPVPINAAGGEVAIPPEVVMTIGGGDIKRGHEMLDQWVLLNRKKHISTLRKLPGPAKS